MSERQNSTDKEIEAPEVPREVIKLGSIVVARLKYTDTTYGYNDEETEETLQFRLIREGNKDTSEGSSIEQISDKAALGRAVLDRIAGESTYYDTPDGLPIDVNILEVDNSQINNS